MFRFPRQIYWCGVTMQSFGSHNNSHRSHILNLTVFKMIDEARMCAGCNLTEGENIETFAEESGFIVRKV